MFTFRSPRARRLLVGAIAVPVAIAVTASAAAADTSTASASAFYATDFPSATPPPAAASNDGSQPTQTDGFGNGAVTLLPANSWANDGALAQLAVAEADGTSKACAGMVTDNGSLDFAAGGACSATSPAADLPFFVDVPNKPMLRARAAFAQCSADSAGNVTGSTEFVGGRFVDGSSLSLISLIPANPAPNTPIQSLLPSAEVIGLLNRQVVNSDGSLSVTAMVIRAAGQPTLELGKVTCGPNVRVADVPLVPGLPADGTAVAAGVVALAVGAVGARRLRNRQPVAA